MTGTPKPLANRPAETGGAIGAIATLAALDADTIEDSEEGSRAPTSDEGGPPDATLVAPPFHPDAGIQTRNHYKWFMPKDPAGVVTPEWLDATEAKMREGLTDIFVHDMAQVVLTLIGAYRQITLRPP